MASSYTFDVTVNAGDLLALLSAAIDQMDTILKQAALVDPDQRIELGRRVDVLHAHHKTALEAWAEGVSAYRESQCDDQPRHRNSEDETVKFEFAPESKTEWTIHDYQGNQVDGYDCRQAALESMSDSVHFNDCDHLPSIHFLVQGRKTIVKTMGRRKARRKYA